MRQASITRLGEEAWYSAKAVLSEYINPRECTMFPILWEITGDVFTMARTSKRLYRSDAVF